MEGIMKIFYSDEIETYALSDVYLTIKEGDFVSVAGPSGCGKSTLLSILGLLETPTDGRYCLDGLDVRDLGRNELAYVRNAEIGFIFQSFNLIGDLTVEENVELPLAYGGMPAEERKKRAKEVLERVEMSHRRNHLPYQLSGGQQQRVAVARALSTTPKILLADEPTGNLDSKNGDRVMDLLKELHGEGTTICMVTHDSRYNAHADRVLSLFDGRVVNEEGLVEVTV
ncbi:ABC transporter ATP-binding protein [Pelagicoccus mobilis]|uniref:ABC transporter ATP-binding protein n=3 Tax=Pelagicoccus mobilis TaxID=415221 RepID=A0A934RY09_9BACT|nr:ABC transporter ATP-binding protein [Pelagicoccus mobilis]